MEKKIYSRQVVIRDKNKDRWEIEFKVYEETPSVRKNKDTLEEFKENLNYIKNIYNVYLNSYKKYKEEN